LVNIGAAGQAALTAAGSAGQQALIDAGRAGQQNLIDRGRMIQEQGIRAASAMQTNAIELASLTGLRNETAEKEISKITKGIEASNNTEIKGMESTINTETKGFEASIATETKGFESSLNTETKGFEASLDTNVKGFEAGLNAVVGGIEDLGMFLNPGKTEGTSQTTEGDGLDPIEMPKIGDEEVFEEIEGSTTKADQMTEEERQRRIRRLMLNRYGREDTILTGARDTTNRRRYASAL
jgi:hypothetical protein